MASFPWLTTECFVFWPSTLPAHYRLRLICRLFQGTATWSEQAMLKALFVLPAYPVSPCSMQDEQQMPRARGTRGDEDLYTYRCRHLSPLVAPTVPLAGFGQVFDSGAHPDLRVSPCSRHLRKDWPVHVAVGPIVGRHCRRFASQFWMWLYDCSDASIMPGSVKPCVLWLQVSWHRRPSASWRRCLGTRTPPGCTVWPMAVTLMR